MHKIVSNRREYSYWGNTAGRRIAATQNEESGVQTLKRRTPKQHVIQPPPASDVTIIHLGIVCCVFTLAIAVAVAVAAFS
jgi:hypothetical protein